MTDDATLATPEADFGDWGRRLLETIETRLAQALESHSALVTEIARHLSTAGGKRFRPMLVVGAAGLGFDVHGQVDEEATIRAALVIELTHVASLYHDDVMDEAELRRGADSVNKRWGNSLAILTGDFIFSRASSIVASLGLDYAQFQADTFSRLVTGQIEELKGPTDGADPVAHHLRVIADKTASLIAASARFGGMVAELADDQLAALTRYGEALGTAFQLADDLIDIFAENSGKAIGTDLREGVPTLVTLFVQRAARPADARLRQLLSGPVAADDLAEALELLKVHPAVAGVRTAITAHAETARQELSHLPAGPAAEMLDALCDAAVTRVN